MLEEKILNALNLNDNGNSIKNMLDSGEVTIKEIKDIALNSDENAAYNFAYLFGNDKDIENRALTFNDPFVMLSYVCNINGVNKLNFINRIIELGNIDCIFFVARENFFGAPVDKLEDALLANLDTLNKKELKKRANLIYFFALCVVDANISKLVKGLVRTRNSQYIYYFLLNVKCLDKTLKTLLINTLIEIRDPEYMFLILRDDLVDEEEQAKLISYFKGNNGNLYLSKLILLDKPYSANLLEFIIALRDINSMLYIAKRTDNMSVLEILVDELNKINLDVLSMRREEEERSTGFRTI